MPSFASLGMRRLLREPLLHFLLLGITIFVAHALFSGRDGGGGPQRIAMTQGQIASMAEVFAKSWQRPPSSDELAGLIRARLREEVYYREAMALGLGNDDTVIRRRMTQKMEFVLDDVSARAAPTDAELSAYLQAHPESFGLEETLTFRQVYLDPQKRGDRLASDAERLAATLNQAGEQADASAQGDPFALEHTFLKLPRAEVARQLGQPFAAALTKLPLGRWQPVQSGYGMHLVRVDARTEAGAPALDKVREVVQRELGNSRRLEANEKMYQQMLGRYTVVIEPVDSTLPKRNKAP